MKIAIIGENSSIGSALKQRCLNVGIEVITTSRRTDAKSLMFDFEQSKTSDLAPLLNVDAVFIGAAITSQSICENNQDLARRVNLLKTIDIINFFKKNGVFVMVPSTNLVLGGLNSFAPANSVYNPIGVYASLKVELEKFCLSEGGIGLLRLTKVLEPNRGIISSWTDAIAGSKKINIMTGVKISPVSLTYVVDGIVRLVRVKEQGIWQFSGAQDLSYLELFQKFVLLKQKKIGKKLNLKASYFESEQVVRYGSLDASRYYNRFKISPHDPTDMLNEILL